MPKYDEQGGLAYKAQVINPFTRLDDGRAYRVVRTPQGQHRYMDIEAEGSPGQDYHVDPASGEKFVTVNGAGGGSKREVIGQDHFVPAANAMRAVQSQHQADAETAGADRDDAEHGIPGAEGYGGFPLSDLRGAHGDVVRNLAQARRTVDYIDAKVAAYVSGQSGEVLTPEEQAAVGPARRYLAEHGQTADALSTEIDARTAAHTQAQQRYTESMRARNEAAGFRNMLTTPAGQTAVKADLGSVLAGGSIDQRRAGQLQAAGLLDEDGTVSETGRALLGGGRMPRPVAPSSDVAEPGRQTWQVQQRAILKQFPQTGEAGSTAAETFARAFRSAGSDPRLALQIAQAVLGRN